MLRPYVEQKVAEYLGIEKVAVDDDGDIPIKAGSAVCYARLFDSSNGPIFRAFAPLLLDVPKSEALLERLNELNGIAHFVRYFWQAEQVFCSVDLPAEDLQPGEIQLALLAVSVGADEYDDELKTAFGGRRMIEGEPKPEGSAPGKGGTAASGLDAAGPDPNPGPGTGTADTAYL